MNILHYTESNVTVYKTNKHYMKVKLNNKSFIIIASKIEDLCVILVLIMKKGVALGEKIYITVLTKEIYIKKSKPCNQKFSVLWKQQIKWGNNRESQT